MRRTTAFFTLLTLLFTLTASSEMSAPNFIGRWQTSMEETLCSTLLTLTPTGHFYMTSEGVTYTGTWTQEGGELLLQGASRAPYMPSADDVPFSVTYTYDSASGALDIGSGLHLYRTLPEMEGFWLYFPETYSGFVNLMLSESRFHLTYTTLSDERIPPLPDGGLWFEGTWWLEGTWTQEGSSLTLHAENGCMYTFTQDTTTGLLVSEDGYMLYRYD